jgi:hypothetical protein
MVLKDFNGLRDTRARVSSLERDIANGIEQQVGIAEFDVWMSLASFRTKALSVEW